MPLFETLARFWSEPMIASNVLVCMNLLGALFLGLLVGYERSYHGRAAGMRTYGMVCMASAALTVISGYSGSWFGGAQLGAAGGDATRVIQGIVTGIGFLCAGVIMREGFNISGLTTAASLWAVSVIGILVGVGFYLAAFGLALLSAICMTWISKLEMKLPACIAVAVTLKFRENFVPNEKELRLATRARGYVVAGGSIAISSSQACVEWRFVAVALSRHQMSTLPDLAAEISNLAGVTAYQLGYARN